MMGRNRAIPNMSCKLDDRINSINLKIFEGQGTCRRAPQSYEQRLHHQPNPKALNLLNSFNETRKEASLIF